MVRAWITVECPACLKVWEATPESLPTPDTDFECPYCSVKLPTSEFLPDGE